MGLFRLTSQRGEEGGLERGEELGLERGEELGLERGLSRS